MDLSEINDVEVLDEMERDHMRIIRRELKIVETIRKKRAEVQRSKLPQFRQLEELQPRQSER